MSAATLPCPICSHVIYRGGGGTTADKPICVTPGWVLAKCASAAARKDLYLWNGCTHAEAIGPKNAIENDMRSLTEAKWDQEARRLFDEKTKSWNEKPRRDFGMGLGFVAREALVS